MPKKKKDTKLKISAEHAGDEQLNLTINDETFNCKIFQNGKIKFSFKHPELSEAMQYEGIVEGNTLYLYPIAGRGVLTTSPVPIK